MPIMAFRQERQVPQGVGPGDFPDHAFLRTDRDGNVWVPIEATIRCQVQSEGKLLLTLGRKGWLRERIEGCVSNGVADLVIAKNGDISCRR